jgi:uncharacterized YigZ family protein
MTRKLVPAKQTRAEISIENSRFIATLSPAFSVYEARSFYKKIKSEFKDASHNVQAFVIGHGASITTHANDDGEPSGTAGRPALATLQGSGLGDVALVVTRYFGGKKLGKGGLVRAYRDSVKAVLELTSLAEKSATYLIMITTSYPLYEPVFRLIKTHKGNILERDFRADVTFTVSMPMNRYTVFNQALNNIGLGKLDSIILEENDSTILPLDRNVIQNFHNEENI